MGRQRCSWLAQAGANAGITAASLVLNLISGGWFSYYIFELPARHPIEWRMLFDYWRYDLLAPLPFALLVWALVRYPDTFFLPAFPTPQEVYPLYERLAEQSAPQAGDDAPVHLGKTTFSLLLGREIGSACFPGLAGGLKSGSWGAEGSQLTP